MSGPRPLVYSVPEVARLLGVSRSHAYTLIGRGEFPLPVRALGRRLVVPRAEVDRFLAGEPATTSP